MLKGIFSVELYTVAYMFHKSLLLNLRLNLLDKVQVLKTIAVSNSGIN